MSAPVTTAEAPYTWETFLDLHKSQFENMKLPKFLWKVAYKKFISEKYLLEEAEAFEIKEEEAGLQLYATAAQRRWADLWIVPHFLTGTGNSILAQLLEDPELVDSCWNMMQLDHYVVSAEEEAEQAKHAKIAAKAAAKSKAKEDKLPPGASRIVHHEADLTMVEMVMAGADVSRERAIQALEASGNDLIASITECNLLPEFVALEQHMGKMLLGNYGEEGAVLEVCSDEEKEEEKEEEVVVVELSEEAKRVQRAKTVFVSLFKLDYVGFYMTMLPRAADSTITGPPRLEEIIKNYYVMDGTGSAVSPSNEPNVKMAHFVSLVHGGQGWTFMWAEKDIKIGEKITKARTAAIPVPIEF